MTYIRNEKILRYWKWAKGMESGSLGTIGMLFFHLKELLVKFNLINIYALLTKREYFTILSDFLLFHFLPQRINWNFIIRHICIQTWQERGGSWGKFSRLGLVEGPVSGRTNYNNAFFLFGNRCQRKIITFCYILTNSDIKHSYRGKRRRRRPQASDSEVSN